MSGRQARVTNADMSVEMQQDTVDCATEAIEIFNIERVSVLLWSLVLKTNFNH